MGENLQIALQALIEKLDERLMREDNSFFHRQCRSQRGREYSSCGIFLSSCDARMCLYLGGMRGQDVDYIFSSEWDQGSFFLKTGGSHFNKYRIIWTECPTRRSDILTLQFLATEPNGFSGFTSWIVWITNFISATVLRATVFVKVPEWKIVLSGKLCIGLVTLWVITQNRLRWRERQGGRPRRHGNREASAAP